jgi:FixJ family two-component response regulator
MRSAPVLLLDDDSIVLEHLPRLLMRRFPAISVETFSSPQEALLRFERRDYSVVVTDVTMPGMNGLDVLEAVKKRRTATPVVLMTGRADESLMQYAFDLGAYDVLSKPLDRTEFTDVIQSAVETRALARRVQATQLILTKWKKRFLAVEQVVNGANDRPLDHLKDEALHMVLSSRRLNDHSLVTIGASIERLQQYVLMNEKKLHEAREQVMACYERHRRLAFTRGMRP